jgi:hypothetical protein
LHPSNFDILPASGGHLPTEREVIVLECIRQSRLSFNLTLALMGLNIFVTGVGVWLLLFPPRHVTEGTVIMVVGLVSNILTSSRRLSRDTSENLYKLVIGTQKEE